MTAEHDCDFDRIEVPYLTEFAMWAVILLAVVAPVFMLGQALMLAYGKTAAANHFYNAVTATLQIALGLTFWPMLYVGLDELYHRAPAGARTLINNWQTRLTNWT